MAKQCWAWLCLARLSLDMSNLVRLWNSSLVYARHNNIQHNFALISAIYHNLLYFDTHQNDTQYDLTFTIDTKWWIHFFADCHISVLLCQYFLIIVLSVIMQIVTCMLFWVLTYWVLGCHFDGIWLSSPPPSPTLNKKIRFALLLVTYC